jgi:hypothetical protein
VGEPVGEQAKPGSAMSGYRRVRDPRRRSVQSPETGTNHMDIV